MLWRAKGSRPRQAGVNQTGPDRRDARGAPPPTQTAQAQQAAAQLQSNVAGAKNSLLGQVQASESIGSPIAGSTIEDVGSALQTQRSAVSGVASNAGDTASSFNAVPQVSTLGNLFSGVLGAGANVLGGANAGSILSQFKAGQSGLAANAPNTTSTK